MPHLQAGALLESEAMNRNTTSEAATRNRACKHDLKKEVVRRAVKMYRTWTAVTGAKNINPARGQHMLDVHGTQLFDAVRELLAWKPTPPKPKRRWRRP